MNAQPLSQYCQVFVDELQEGIDPKRIRLNNLGINEGCEVDVAHPASLEATSIKIDGQGRPFGEIMVPHCRANSSTGEMYLLTTGMELCGGNERQGLKGCQIDQVHVHAWSQPSNHVVGSTHIHFECQDLDRHPSHTYCIKKLADSIIKLDRYTSKNCT
jgi:hypothetical protein